MDLSSLLFADVVLVEEIAQEYFSTCEVTAVLQFSGLGFLWVSGKFFEAREFEEVMNEVLI